MSLVSSLFSGVSGLRNHQKMMDVIGNNIANVNTVGFKGSRVTFSDTFNQYVRYGSEPNGTLGGTNAFQIGLGVDIASIDKNWSQGTFEKTGITTDLALKGDGLFVLKRGSSQVYSRAGSFLFDANGRLVTQDGDVVQGKVATSDGVIPPGNNIEDIMVDPNTKIPAVSTTKITWGGNLQSSSALTRTENFKETGNINASDAVGSVSSETGTVYDDNGNAYSFKTNYTKTAADTYSLTYTLTDSSGATVIDTTATPKTVVFGADGNMSTIDGAAPTAMTVIDVAHGINFKYNPAGVKQAASSKTLGSVVDDGRTPNIQSGTVTIYDSLGTTHSLTMKYTKTASNSWNWTASVPSTSGTVTANTGTITFNADGSVNTISPNPPTIQFTPLGGANPQNIELDLGTGFKGITQTSSSSVVSALSQDGSAAASLDNLTIDQNGKVIGVFSNGASKNLAQIMLATFPNLNGLANIGDNLLTQSANSGQPFIGEAGSTVQTLIQSGVLEQSNVDLSEEFTRMIISQRGFQANARVITTSDNLLQEITNLVR